MRDIIIYGAGGFGRETALMIRQINERFPRWNILGFCDDGFKKGESVNGLPIIGGLKELNTFSDSASVVLAVADPSTRKAIRERITNPGIDYPTLIHPSVSGGDLTVNRVDEGCIVTAGNILTTDIHLESFVIVNLSSTIGHDVSIGKFSSIMPGCSLSGMVKIGSEVLVGTGAKILQNIEIRDRSRVGAGAVVTHDVPADTTVVGIPARPVSKK